jgi:hypothetical protein
VILIWAVGEPLPAMENAIGVAPFQARACLKDSTPELSRRFPRPKIHCAPKARSCAKMTP